MFRILFSLIFVLFLSLSNTQSQNSDDMPWEILMFQDNVNVNDVIQKFNTTRVGKAYQKGAGIKPFRRWEYINQKRVNAQGELNRFEQIQSYRAWKKSYTPPVVQQRTMTCPVSATGDWKSQGPNRAVENYGIGRINAVAFHPTDPNQLWAASPSGGIWISYDYGDNWQTMTDDFTTLGFSDIAFNPLNPNTIYAATGDKDSGDAPSIGVIKTTDGGLTWSVVHSTSSRIHRLLVNPSDTSMVLAATSSGLYRTTDAGSSWTNELDEYIRHMEFKPGSPSTVYASAYETDARFFRSTNSGDSWSTISLPAVTNTPRRLSIGVTTANHNIVYLSGGYSDGSNSNDFSALYKSTDGGLNFSVVGGVPTLGSQYWYDWTIAVSPTDANVIFAGGLGLDRSTNGGVSWSDNGSGVHVDHHFAGYHPITGDLFVASDGGIYYSSNQGVTWNFINKGMSIAQYYRLSTSDTEGDLIIAGAQDNGSHLLNDDYWDRVSGGDGMECIINHQDENIMYCESQRGNIRRSTNKGVTFSTIFNPSNVGESGAWVTPYVMHPTNPSILYAGYSSVHKSTNGGSTWSNSSGILATTLTVLAISEDDPDYVYAGTTSSLWRTTDGGGSWNAVTSPAGFTDYIAIDPDDADILYATSSFSIYKSTDGGMSWVDISGSLPSISINCVTMQQGPNDPLYVGTDFGVYYKDDGLGDWILFSEGLPNVVISELEIDACQGMIRAATYGRGIWESPLYCTDVGTICCSNLEPQISPTADVLECSSDIILSATPGPNNYDIQWYRNGDILPGANLISYTAANSGDYSYRLINPSNGSCNSMLSKILSVNFVCFSESECSDLNPNTDNGTGNTTVININGAFDDIASEATAAICISVNGDFANIGSENMTIYDEANNNRGLTKNVSDCSGPSEEICFVISSTDFNLWNDDNNITITLDPVSTTINQNLCATNEVCARLFLPALTPCPPNDSLYLTGTLASGIYKAAIHIDSDASILSGNMVILESGDHVDLMQSFEVENNAEFEVKITPCVAGSSARNNGQTRSDVNVVPTVPQARLLYD